MTKSRPPSPRAAEPAFRSGAVARMAGMPVATLRIWEQRYRAVQPATAASGHRLYAPADVQRVLLLRRLTEQGHAIGSIALLTSAQLEALAPAPAVLRVVVVGPALALRLQRPGVAPALRLAAVFATLDEAAQAAAPDSADLLLWHAPELPAAPPAALDAARTACGARRAAVLYRFGSAAALQALAAAGALAAREPADDAALRAWLPTVEAALPARARAPAPRRSAGLPPGALAPRRFDDATLTAIAGRTGTLACECPRHVAELLMQLASFEAYSAGCVNRSPADAALHQYLQQVAGASRTLFESALEHVARHEGLALR